MDLIRFAIVQFSGLAEKWTNLALSSDDLEVVPTASGAQAGKTYVLVGAVVPLEATPPLDAEGFVTVPDEERRQGERAIERYASHVSVISGRQVEIFSPHLPVAFRGSPVELSPLRESSGLVDFDRYMAADSLNFELPVELVNGLDDRQDGVAQLAEALGTQLLGTQFQGLIRLFERAFALSSNRLVLQLSEFLSGWPALSYSKTEVKNWISRMRGSAVHADRGRPFLREADYRAVLPRMLFAGYDLLLNKEVWQDPQPGRRDRWAPTYGPLEGGGMVGEVGETVVFGMQMVDRYAAFRTNAQVPDFELGEDCWPRSRAASMRSTQQSFEAVEPADFRRPDGGARAFEMPEEGLEPPTRGL